MISYRYWQDELGGELEALGTTIEIGLRSFLSESEETPVEYRIVGIMSPEMTGLWAEQAGIWLPLERAVGLDGVASMMAFGRRSDGASLRAVREELNARYPRDGDGYRLEPGTRLDISPGIVTIAFVAVLTMLLLIASLGPAQQARRTQPAELLRED